MMPRRDEYYRKTVRRAVDRPVGELRSHWAASQAQASQARVAPHPGQANAMGHLKEEQQADSQIEIDPTRIYHLEIVTPSGQRTLVSANQRRGATIMVTGRQHVQGYMLNHRVAAQSPAEATPTDSHSTAVAPRGKGSLGSFRDRGCRGSSLGCGSLAHPSTTPRRTSRRSRSRHRLLCWRNRCRCDCERQLVNKLQRAERQM